MGESRDVEQRRGRYSPAPASVYEEGAPADSKQQGNVYAQIIEKVIEASSNDFEEFGVDSSTLEEMKQVSGCLAQQSRRTFPLSSQHHKRTSRFSALVSPIVFHRFAFLVAIAAFDDGALQPGLVVMGGRKRG